MVGSQIPGEEWDKKEEQNRASDDRVGGEDVQEGDGGVLLRKQGLGGLEVEEEGEKDEDEFMACRSMLSVREGLAELSMHQSSSKMGFSPMSPPGSPLMAAAPSFPGAAHSPSLHPPNAININFGEHFPPPSSTLLQ
ncbi:hypothetical protein Taro_025343 [Colocasia esculenta]|uniref:Uncharacterized protein n=1 Tax=Colocasia esculenta TaxID=4460 RepID=A0A843VHA7_COLES|nr:hypothetical protein [Colocasia esculenta]